MKATRVFRTVVTVILILPLVLWSLLPAGYMPGQDESGAFTIVICTGHGVQEITVTPDMDPAEGGPSHHGVDAGPCPFGLTSLTALVDLPEPGQMIRLPRRVAHPFVVLANYQPTRRHQVAEARAPPSLI